MRRFDLDRYSDDQRHSGWLPAAAALLGAGAAAWFICTLPRSGSLSLLGLIGSSAQRVLVVALTASAIVWLLSRKQSPVARRLALGASVNALWLVPLALLVREHSAWALLAATLFVCGATPSLYFLSRQPQDQPDDSPHHPFALIGSSIWSWRQPAAIAAALVAQVAALLSSGGYIVSASLLFGASAVIWAVSYSQLSTNPGQPISRSEERTVLLSAAAILCTFAALMPFLRISLGLGGFGVSAHHASLRSVPLRKIRSEGTERPTGDFATGPSDGHTGVILWAAEETHIKLIAPPPVLATNRSSSATGVDPLIIPFDGVYWFFKAPDTSPPQTSKQAQGSPELLDIRSTDWRPLSMEAHENLGSLIDLDCCSRIQIAIRNRDRYPETVSLELVLIDSTLPGKPSLSLGSALVRSTRAWRIYDKPAPASETLDFAIPVKHAIHRFDEVTIVFRLDSARSDAGAKIAIDRFVLIPRGL